MDQVVRDLYSVVILQHTLSHLDLMALVLKIVHVQLVDEVKVPLVVGET